MIRRGVLPDRTDSMIVTRTPLRLSFAGGGTDLPAYYERLDGAVLSSAIDQYVFVTVKRHGSFFDEPIRVNYAKSEMVERVDDIQNDIVRESLRFLGIDAPIYVSVVGDLPASSGLGGSSSFAVSLLNALHAYRGERVTAGQLAEESSHVEIDVLGQPIGKQDQYAAAFGGLNLYTFRSGGSASVEPIRLGQGVAEALFERVMLFWTGWPRDAGRVLRERSENTPTSCGTSSASPRRTSAPSAGRSTRRGSSRAAWRARSPARRSTAGTSWRWRPAPTAARWLAPVAVASCCSSSRRTVRRTSGRPSANWSRCRSAMRSTGPRSPCRSGTRESTASPSRRAVVIEDRIVTTRRVVTSLRCRCAGRPGWIRP